MRPADSDSSTAEVFPVQLHAQRARTDSVRLFLVHWRGALTALALIMVAVALTVQDLLPLRTWTIWFVLTSANTIAQAAICRTLESAASLGDAMKRWQHWLVASIGFNALIWGCLPLLLLGVSTQVVLSMCVLNAMVVFCIASGPGTPGMLLAAAVPIGVLGTLALLLRGDVFHVGVGHAVLLAVIAFHGLRLQTALRAGMVERYVAEDLSLALHANQQKLMDLERDRTLLIERHRLTRDMHDGLGSTLVASLAEVERGELRPERLAAMLRDCVDDLRMVIDSLEPVDHDLTPLLATLRMRLERRLDAAGIRLDWQMGDLPQLRWMGAPEALHVTRMVQEVLANVIKHAQARHIRLTVSTVGDEIEIRIVDDGKGFDPGSTPPGRGLQFLRERAASLDGHVDIDAVAGRGTSVRLRLPVCVPDASAPSMAQAGRRVSDRLAGLALVTSGTHGATPPVSESAFDTH